MISSPSPVAPPGGTLTRALQLARQGPGLTGSARAVRLTRSVRCPAIGHGVAAPSGSDRLMTVEAVRSPRIGRSHVACTSGVPAHFGRRGDGTRAALSSRISAGTASPPGRRRETVALQKDPIARAPRAPRPCRCACGPRALPRRCSAHRPRRPSPRIAATRCLGPTAGAGFWKAATPSRCYGRTNPGKKSGPPDHLSRVRRQPAGEARR